MRDTMDIKKLRELFTKLVYQDTLDLDDKAVRFTLQDLVNDEIKRLREVENREWRMYQVERANVLSSR